MPIVLATILITVIALLLAVGKGIYDLFVYFRYMWSPSVPRVDTVIVEHLKENNYFLQLSLKGKSDLYAEYASLPNIEHLKEDKAWRLRMRCE